MPFRKPLTFGMKEMAYRTYAEWQARGRYVVAGEKAMGKLNDGTALFGKEQTKKVKKKHFYSELVLGRIQSGVNWDQSMDWDEQEELGLSIGLPGQW